MYLWIVFQKDWHQNVLLFAKCTVSSQKYIKSLKKIKRYILEFWKETIVITTYWFDKKCFYTVGPHTKYCMIKYLLFFCFCFFNYCQWIPLWLRSFNNAYYVKNFLFVCFTLFCISSIYIQCPKGSLFFPCLLIFLKKSSRG